MDAEAGIVDQNFVAMRPRRQRRYDDSIDSVHDKSAGDNLGLDPVLTAAIRRNFAQCGFVSRDEHKIETAGGELEGERFADAG